ncbi:MAG: site-2 protease family protein [Aquificae bacterium]|nr:site-2 protease family protein [Aquificota bacterium]
MTADLFFGFLQWLALVFIFTVHNYIKAITVIRMGDDTPRRFGFDTLNPLPHIDPIGTVVLPLAFILLKSPLVIGWPRPVPVDYSRFRSVKRAVVLIAAVSILSYFFIGAVAYALYKTLFLFPLPETVVFPLSALFQFTVIISVFFGFLNLIPIPPMEMGYIVFSLMGKDVWEIHRYALFGSLIILLLFVSGVLAYLFKPIYVFLLTLL